MEKWLSIIIITFFIAACVVITTLAIIKNRAIDLIDLTDPIAQRIYATSKFNNAIIEEKTIEKIFELEKKKEDNK